MHTTIEMLMKGDQSVPENFMAAAGRWKDLLADIDDVDVGTLARRLTDNQMWFEHNCGGRWVGQEVMVWTGFAHLYSTHTGWDGNESRGEKLAAAFSTSMVSLEVKGGARRAAKSYSIEMSHK